MLGFFSTYMMKIFHYDQPPECRSVNKLKSGEHRLNFIVMWTTLCCSLRQNHLLFTVNPGATVSGVGSLKYLPRLFYDSSLLHTFGSARAVVSFVNPYVTYSKSNSIIGIFGNPIMQKVVMLTFYFSNVARCQEVSLRKTKHHQTHEWSHWQRQIVQPILIKTTLGEVVALQTHLHTWSSLHSHTWSFLHSQTFQKALVLWVITILVRRPFCLKKICFYYDRSNPTEEIGFLDF